MITFLGLNNNQHLISYVVRYWIKHFRVSANILIQRKSRYNRNGPHFVIDIYKS